MTRPPTVKSLKFWECPSCGSAYFDKPEKCENEGRNFWSGYPTGCGEGGSMKEISVEGIESVKVYTETSCSMTLGLSGGKIAYINFLGDTADDRFDQVCKVLGVTNPLRGNR